MAPMDAVEALTRLGGIASTPDLLLLTTRARVETAVRRGTVVRVSRGRLALAQVEGSRRMALLAGGHLSHLSAALHHGWKVMSPPDHPQVILRPGTAPPDGWDDFMAEPRWHRLRAGESDRWATAPLRTVLDCAADLPFGEALCVADSALRSGMVTAAELETAAGPRHRRIATHADARADNPFESALRALCIEIGLPVVPQFEVTCGTLTFHPDLANPLLGLVIEADSYTFHGMNQPDYERDVVRYNALTVTGWTVLRFTWDQVMRQPDYVKGVLLAWWQAQRARK